MRPSRSRLAAKAKTVSFVGAGSITGSMTPSRISASQVSLFLRAANRFDVSVKGVARITDEGTIWRGCNIVDHR